MQLDIWKQFTLTASCKKLAKQQGYKVTNIHLSTILCTKQVLNANLVQY